MTPANAGRDLSKTSMDELGRMSPEAFQTAPKHAIVLVLDNIRSLNNVGSAFRTADAFLIEAIYLCGVTGTPPHKDIEKTALGATNSVSWKYFSTTMEAVKDLRHNGYLLAAIEQTKGSTPLQQFSKPDRPTAFIFGNEVYGVDQDIINLSDVCLEIPQYGTKHSLNVAVSMGIVLWEMLRQR